MTPGATDLLVRLAAALVPGRHRETWRREWQGELGYGWQRGGDAPGFADRWRLTARTMSAVAHAAWLRGQEWTVDHLLQDLRLALRLLRRSPGPSLVAILTLALGIGANTAIFSLVNRVLLKPLPISDIDRLVVIHEDMPGFDLFQVDLAPAEVLDLEARDDLFGAVAGVRASDRTLTGFGEPTRIRVAASVGDIGSVLATPPAAGRFYGPDHARTGPHEVAVVSHAMWQQLGGGDSSFIGRRIVLDGTSHEIVGVMPQGVRYPRDADVWVPFRLTGSYLTDRGRLFMATIARLAPGVTEAQLRAGLAGEVARWNEQFHAGSPGKRLTAVGLVEHLAGPLRLILLVLLGAVLFVLMIAAANVASLQLVRTASRAREIAVRSAIGAGRGRIVRQFLLESACLSLAGGLLGLALGALGLKLLGAWAPARQMYMTGLGLDGTVLAFTAGVTALAAVIFGTAPALRGATVSPEGVLREQRPSVSTGAARWLLAGSSVTQVALALVLVLGSGLMVRTLSVMLAAEPGFQPQGLLTAQVSLPGTVYDSAAKTLGFFDELLARVRSLDAVQSAALVTGVPFAGANDSSPFDIPERPAGEHDPRRHAEATIVTAGYFETMGIPIVAGRDFDGTERPGSPLVALVDQTFADQFFPGEDPVGRRILSGYFGNEPATIIGVVGRVDHDEIGDAPKAVTYYATAHQYWWTSRSIVVRSSADAGALANRLRAIVSELDPRVPLYDVQTMEARIDASLGPRRLAMLALGGFSTLSLLLAALGVYGVVRHTTAQRTREIGIRIALGARPGAVAGRIVLRSVAICALGVSIGTAVALTATRLMTGILFGVSPHDPATFGAGIVALTGVTVLASLVPALRAARIDPAATLRTE